MQTDTTQTHSHSFATANLFFILRVLLFYILVIYQTFVSRATCSSGCIRFTYFFFVLVPGGNQTNLGHLHERMCGGDMLVYNSLQN